MGKELYGNYSEASVGKELYGNYSEASVGKELYGNYSEASVGKELYGNYSEASVGQEVHSIPIKKLMENKRYPIVLFRSFWETKDIRYCYLEDSGDMSNNVIIL